MAVGFMYDERFLGHHAGPLPECAARLVSLVRHLQSTGLLDRLTLLPPRPAEREVLQLVHTEAYLSRFESAVKALQDSGSYVAPFCTKDVFISPQSWSVALLAVGGVLEACDAVMAGRVEQAFCALRPPGHHAQPDSAQGFCLLNNTAIAARYLQTRHHLGRIAIVDFDLHHCNGTQTVFESDNTVLVISLHQHPSTIWPGTGYAWERGKGQGDGFTINLPMPPGSDDADYQEAFSRHVLPALHAFRPEALLVSAGFDAHLYDPLGLLHLSSVGYAWMTRQLKNLAYTHANGRLISILEGGYNLKALAWSVQSHLEALLEATPEHHLMSLKAGTY